MNQQAQQRLLQLFEDGHSIKINNGYVTGMVYDMHKRDNDNEVVFTDEVFTDCPLSDIPTWYVEVFWKIDEWQYEDISTINS